MRHILTLILGILGTISVYADCSGSGLWVFPIESTIKQNSIFILDGYSESQEVILKLNKKHNIYLKNGDKKIKLIVTEICVGEFFLTQAVLKPETELDAGLEYIMIIDSLPTYQSFNRYNNVTKEYEPVKFKVLSEKDTVKPLIYSRPQVLTKSLQHFGCGPSIHVIFSNPTKEIPDIIVKTTVKNLKTGKETTYYIMPKGYTIEIGHGMCSGAFNFDKGNNYEVEFSFMDSCGNITNWSGERIKFTKPID